MRRRYTVYTQSATRKQVGRSDRFFNCFIRYYLFIFILLGTPVTARTAVEQSHLEYLMHVQDGFIFLFRGDNQSAIASLEKALEIEPNHFEIHHHLGMAYGESEFWNKAIASYQKSLDLVPDNIEALYSLGVAYFELGEWEQALSIAQKAVALSSTHARAHDLLGRTQVKLRQFEEAIETLKKAVELNPKSPRVYQELGTAYLSLEKYEEAIHYFEQASQLAPDYANPHHGLGTAYLRLGNREKGRAEMLRFQELQKESTEYERLVRLTHTEPNNIDGWAGLARLLLSQKKYGEAIATFEECIKLDPKNAGFYHGISQAFIHLGYPVPARQAVLKAIQLEPNIAVLYNTLGSTYASQGQIEDAIEAFRKAVSLAPEVPYFHLNLAKLYEQIGHQRLAEEHYQAYERFK